MPMEQIAHAPGRPYHHGHLKRAIIDAALQMLSEGEGWQFTLREVARRAGVSHAAPYKHFADKGALLAEVALEGFDRLGRTLAATVEEAKADAAEALTQAARAYLAFGQANPALYRLMFGAELASSTKLHQDRRALGAFEIVIALLEQGQAAGVFRKRPARGQAAACWAQLHGLTTLMLDGLLIPEKVGANPIEAALSTLREGLDIEPPRA